MYFPVSTTTWHSGSPKTKISFYFSALELEDQQDKTSTISKNAKKKTKEKEMSPVPEIEEESATPTPRRLRHSGKAESNQADSAAENSGNKKNVKRGRKRKASVSKDEVDEEPPAKKENLEKTPLKSLSQSSPAKSPAGVNRR